MTGAPLFQVRNGGASRDGERLLRDLDLELPDRAISVLLGPGAAGKSTLLQLLGGRRVTPQVERSGEWCVRGREIPEDGACELTDLVWLPQRSHSWRRRGGVEPAGPGAAADLSGALASGASTLLLDEPELATEELEHRSQLERLRGQRERGGMVLVTHDIELTRALADHVVLLYQGRVVAAAAAAEFFARPPNAMAAQFIRSGNCAPPRAELPRHFRWVVPGQVAAMARPGLMAPLEEELAALVQAGVEILVSLTEEAPPVQAVRDAGLELRHLPIPDMGVPSVASAARLCRDLERALAASRAIVVHCHAGLGRTGLLIAALLVWLGELPENAIERVRCGARNAIQTRAQEEFVRRFAAEVAPSEKAR